ncbi:MAG: tRNA (adenosine(37)-N6)-dimethylallyltransferase MiaA, partial [Candidatus Kuenenbacteria bacterium]
MHRNNKKEQKLNLPQLIVILGPTASGKTELALKLAKKFNGEIVSADSRQVYKKMDIGTNKLPTTNHQLPTANHMIDVVDPDKEFTLAKYKKKALKIIKNIQNQGKLPFLVGGTGLYISSIIDNFKIPKVLPNEKLRKKIENEIKKYGLEKVYQKLLKLDPGVGKFVQ